MSVVVSTTTADRPKLDFGTVFKQSWRLFVKDLGALIIATVVAVALSVVTVGILAGPLTAGLYGMVVGRVRDGKTPHVGDVFDQFDRFWSFFGAALVLFVLVGLASLTIVGGILLAAAWLYVVPLMVDRNMRFGEALGESYRMVKAAGYWEHVAFVLIVVVIGALAHGLVALLATPFIVVLVAAAYYVAADRTSELERA
jgi:hypothetical protein